MKPILSASLFLLLLAACSDSNSGDDAAKNDSVPPMQQPAPAAPAEASMLDGRTFIGEVIENGKAAPEKDVLSFNDGRFHSKGCDTFGFGDAPYTTVAEGDAVRFTAVTMSAKEGKIDWSGRVQGDSLDCRMVWTKEGQAPIEYLVKGIAKK